ncbi:MAG: glycoside hydrolase family 9 protein [Planctomycetota bacterium]
MKNPLLLVALTGIVSVSAADLNLGPADAPFRLDFSLPRYDGVTERVFSDLQVIHQRMVIIGNDYTQEARKAAYESKKTELDAIMAEKTEPWSQKKKYDAVFESAFREVYTQYQQLDQVNFFTITSSDDPTYAAGLLPEKVTRWCMPRGNYRAFEKTRGRETTSGVNLANFSYLTLKAPLKTGCTYTITQGDKRRVTFLFDENHTISRALKVNQSGYSPLAKRKYAYLGAWQAGFGAVSFADWDKKPFEVIDADTRKVVHTGTIELLANDPLTLIGRSESSAAGEDLYQLDLSTMTAQGDFYIRVAGIGRSWPFTHSPDGPGKAFYLHLRGLFHNRSGHALDAAYTGWPRPLAHTTAYVGDFAPESPGAKFPVNAFMAIVNWAKTHPDVEWGPAGKGGIGGWYDAADYDKRRSHYETVYDLLIAYELAPKKFTDGQENTYESTNGIPDILDEVAWGLLVWRNSQDKAGGISGHLEARRHPNPAGEKPDGRPHNDPEHYYFSARGRESSLTYAGAAAHLARLLKPFKPDVAQEWLDSAKRAWVFGSDPANQYKRDDYAGSGKPYAEDDTYIAVAWCLSGLELYMATKEQPYLDKAIALFPQMKPKLQWPITYAHHSWWWAFYDDPALPTAIRAAERAEWCKKADAMERFTQDPFYRNPIDPRRAWPTSWGVATGTNDARTLVMAWGLTREQKYFDAIALTADWLQGCNPLGTSWTSGIGYTYPWCFFSGESEEDGIVDPVPGFTVYGVIGGMPVGPRVRGFNLAERTREGWTMKKRLLPEHVTLDKDLKPALPYWRVWFMDYHDAPDMQEYTVNETVSPSILTYAVLLSDGWMPSARLKSLKPRDERFVFGQWPTP